MKVILLVAVITATVTPAFAADVGVSVSIGQPGFYGQIDIGDYPQPRLLYREPRIVEHEYNHRPPIYMRVPPGHARHWDKHCSEYNACGQRVYFVQDEWYNHEYVPRYQERHHEHHDDDGDQDRGGSRSDHGANNGNKKNKH
jgi:hypothetical protein